MRKPISIAIFLLISSLRTVHFQVTNSSFDRHPNVVIIGAGAAGIAAATRLVANGFNVSQITILEAENRIGGRIFSMKYGDNVLEMGAEHVMTKEDNVVYALAYPFLTTKDIISYGDYLSDDKIETTYPNGTRVTRQHLYEFAKTFFAILNSALKTSKPTNESLGQYLVKTLVDYLDQGYLSSLNNQLIWDLLDFHRRNEQHADDWFDLSHQGYRFYLEKYKFDPTKWNTSNGYAMLFDILMNNQKDLFSRIHLNSVVNLIQLDSSKDKVKVHYGNRQTIESDFVIVTTSLGVLKTNKETLFKPPLPERKRLAIEANKAIGYATVCKIFLVFSKPFWTGSNWKGVRLLTDSSNGSSDWTSQIHGFYLARNQPNVLMGILLAPAAIAAETLPEDEVLRKCSILLQEVIQAEADLADFYEPPIRVIRSNWNTNPHFSGSYSYTSVQSNALALERSDLASPVKDSNGVDRLLFAGEATHDSKWTTVHGAVETGWREADRISQLLKLV